MVTNTALNAYIEEVENNIPDVSGLVTNNALIQKSEKLITKFLIMLNALPLLYLINFLVKHLM